MWSMLEECVGQLDEPFRRSEIIGWFRRHHPDVKESTLGAHIQAATANAANRAQNNPLGARLALLRRVDQGVYVRAGQPGEPAVDEGIRLSAAGPEAGQRGRGAIDRRKASISRGASPSGAARSAPRRSSRAL